MRGMRSRTLLKKQNRCILLFYRLSRNSLHICYCFSQFQWINWLFFNTLDWHRTLSDNHRTREGTKKQKLMPNSALERVERVLSLRIYNFVLGHSSISPFRLDSNQLINFTRFPICGSNNSTTHSYYFFASLCCCLLFVIFRQGQEHYYYCFAFRLHFACVFVELWPWTILHSLIIILEYFFSKAIIIKFPLMLRTLLRLFHDERE